MEIIYLPKALDDLTFWKKSGRKNILIKISKLLESIENTPFEGIGKPEELKFDLSGGVLTKSIELFMKLKAIQFMFIPLKDITSTEFLGKMKRKN